MAASEQTSGAPLVYTDDPEQLEIAANELADGRLETAEGKASDAIAVLLSVLPGLGHIYKGHKLIGMLLIFVGTPMAVGLAALIATGTAGFGVALLPVYWLGVMVHVYAIKDRVCRRRKTTAKNTSRVASKAAWLSRREKVNQAGWPMIHVTSAAPVATRAAGYCVSPLRTASISSACLVPSTRNRIRRPAESAEA
jgi:hypothetical protein